MKAIIEEDIIVNLTEAGDVEIGQLPAGVGLERLRWNGRKIVDLADLSEMWVRKAGGGFELHCIEVKDSQLVQMTYADRKRLRTNNSSIKIKTDEEIEAERIASLKQLAKSRLSNRMGDYIDLELAQLAFICALIVYARQQPAQLGNFFDSLIPEISNMFPLDRWQTLLMKFAKNLKQFLEEYYNELDLIP